MARNANKIKHQSGVRAHLRRTFLQRYRQWLTCRKLGSLGDGVFVEANVQFPRHPGNVVLGNDVIVKEGARVCSAREHAKISIGDWTTVGHHTFVFASAGISIGNNCLIAPFCYLVDSNHGIARDKLIREQDMSASPITIEDDVWLGTGAKILKGVTIGKGAVVSAGAIVSSNVPEYAIVAGNPAVVIDERR